MNCMLETRKSIDIVVNILFPLYGTLFLTYFLVTQVLCRNTQKTRCLFRQLLLNLNFQQRVFIFLFFVLQTSLEAEAYFLDMIISNPHQAWFQPEKFPLKTVTSRVSWTYTTNGSNSGHTTLSPSYILWFFSRGSDPFCSVLKLQLFETKNCPQRKQPIITNRHRL